jgi:hypothetical protein
MSLSEIEQISTPVTGNRRKHINDLDRSLRQSSAIKVKETNVSAIDLSTISLLEEEFDIASSKNNVTIVE